jgi:hypothetical protein
MLQCVMSASFRLRVRFRFRHVARGCALLTGAAVATVMTFAVPLRAQETHGALRHLHGVVVTGAQTWW